MPVELSVISPATPQEHRVDPLSSIGIGWRTRLPRRGRLIELNFLGLDLAIVDPMDSYEKADDRLPLMVFCPLSLLSPGDPLEIEGIHVPVPRPSGLVVEKLVTDRSGEKAIAICLWLRACCRA